MIDLLRLQTTLDDDDLERALDLLEGAYWLTDVPRSEIRAAILASTAVVAARDDGGRFVAFARAVSDLRCAWIYDVVVAPGLRNAGVGARVMEKLLDHPAVKNVRNVRLTTRDAMAFYRRLGFVNLDEAPRYAWTSTEMILPRARRSERAHEAETAGAVSENGHDPRLF